MPKVTDVRDLLVHKLAVAHGVEKAVEGMLPKLAREANDDRLRAGFERHLEETRDQIGVLEQAFELLGERPRRGKAPAVEGLQLEHKAFAAEASDDVLPDVLDLVALGSAAATEHHEIAMYEALISLAQSLEANELVELFQRNLEQEQRMLEQVRRLSAQLGGLEAEDERSLAGDLAQGLRQTPAPVPEPTPPTR